MQFLPIISLLIGITSMLHGMSTDLVITMPYQAPISLRHKKKIDTIKAGAVALLSSGTAFAVQNHWELPISTELHMAIPLMSFGAAFLWQKYQTKKKLGQLIDMLLTDPQAALDFLDSVDSEFQGKYYETPVIEKVKKYEQLKNDYEQKCPIFLLGECQADFCPLTRKNVPHIRNEFETAVQDALLEKLKNRVGQNTVEHVSFASGALFTDLVILTKVLAKKPDAAMNVHFIDIQYKIHHIINDFMQKSSEISADSDNSLPEKTEVLLDLFHKHYPDSKENTDEKVYNELLGTYMGVQGRGQQLAQWIATTFPNSYVRFYFHANKDNYLQYACKNGMIPDVLAAIDMELESTFNTYQALHTDMLAMNQNLKSVVCEDYKTLYRDAVFQAHA